MDVTLYLISTASSNTHLTAQVVHNGRTHSCAFEIPSVPEIPLIDLFALGYKSCVVDSNEQFDEDSSIGGSVLLNCSKAPEKFDRHTK